MIFFRIKKEPERKYKGASCAILLYIIREERVEFLQEKKKIAVPNAASFLEKTDVEIVMLVL